jgi:hypothetical protein
MRLLAVLGRDAGKRNRGAPRRNEIPSVAGGGRGSDLAVVPEIDHLVRQSLERVVHPADALEAQLRLSNKITGASKVGSYGCGTSRRSRPLSGSVEAKTSSAPFSGSAPALVSPFPPAAVGCFTFAARSAGILDIRKAQERRPQQADAADLSVSSGRQPWPDDRLSVVGQARR